MASFSLVSIGEFYSTLFWGEPWDLSLNENCPYFSPAATCDRTGDLPLSGIPRSANVPTRLVTEAVTRPGRCFITYSLGTVFHSAATYH